MGDHGRSPRPAEPEQRHGRRAGLRGWAAVGVAAWVVGATVAAAWVAVLAITGSRDSAAHEPSSTAPPSPACRAHGCVGKDPGLMGCGTPSRVRALGSPVRTSTGARLEFRYSAACSAAWARIWHSHIGNVIEVSADGGRPQRAEVTDTYDAEDYVFTPMVDGTDPSRLRVCFEPRLHSTRECFTR